MLRCKRNLLVGGAACTIIILSLSRTLVQKYLYTCTRMEMDPSAWSVSYIIILCFSRDGGSLICSLLHHRWCRWQKRRRPTRPWGGVRGINKGNNNVHGNKRVVSCGTRRIAPGSGDGVVVFAYTVGLGAKGTNYSEL